MNNKDRLHSKAYYNRTRCKGFKLVEYRFRLDIRKTFFMMRVMKHWKRFPREVVDALTLEAVKVRLGLWTTWFSWRCPCSLKVSWTRWHLKVPHNSNSFIILWRTRLLKTERRDEQNKSSIIFYRKMYMIRNIEEKNNLKVFRFSTALELFYRII